MASSLFPEFPDGDDNTYHWTTRLPVGGHQFLIDLMAEHHLNKSQMLRSCVAFTNKYYPIIAEQEGQRMSPQMLAAFKAREAVSEHQERQQVHRRIINLLTMSNESDFEEHKSKLTQAAEELARVNGFGWPPPALPITARDQHAALVLEKVKQIMVDTERNAIRLNELNRRCSSYDAATLRDILTKLKNENYLELEEQNRSGRSTLWIVIPAVEEIK